MELMGIDTFFAGIMRIGIGIEFEILVSPYQLELGLADFLVNALHSGIATANL